MHLCLINYAWKTPYHCIVLLLHIKFGSAIIILNICYTLYVVRNENYIFLAFSGEKCAHRRIINQFRNSPRPRDTPTTYTHIHKNTIISNNRREQKKNKSRRVQLRQVQKSLIWCGGGPEGLPTHTAAATTGYVYYDLRVTAILYVHLAPRGIQHFGIRRHTMRWTWPNFLVFIS